MLRISIAGAAAVCALLGSGSTRAQEADKPAANPIPDGRLRLFDGETTFGWKIEGEAKVVDGVLVLGGTRDTTATTTAWFDQARVTAVYTIADGNKAEFLFHPPTVDRAGTRMPAGRSRMLTVTVTDFEDGRFSDQGGSSASFQGAPRKGPLLAAAPIRFRVPAGAVLSLHSVNLRPLNTKPLFSGKDLSGFKEFPGKKSKFSVTDKGEINVRNGPGDLQTEGKYDDFVLQLECISHGKALNSGIFFRCIDGQYQNGYEAQIQNGYKDNDRTKPADFGTGAIYRRIPARRVVSDDGEWFTMTVVARGNHIATWVNGWQTVDWTDTRPPHENPRNGYRAEKGHISIQGHDPTTNLSFRNLRIAELPREKK
jgi:hypothetical protein